MHQIDKFNFFFLIAPTVQDHDPLWHCLLYPPAASAHTHTHTPTHTGSTVWAERPLCLSDTLHCYPSQMKTRFHVNTSLRFLRLNLVCQSVSRRELTCQRGQRQCGLADTRAHTDRTHSTCAHTHTSMQFPPEQRNSDPLD